MTRTAVAVDYLSIADAARILDVSQPRIFQMLRNGQLRPAIRVSNSYGFTVEEVEEVRRARQRLQLR